jgi:ketosteroid isomerase-like protein
MPSALFLCLASTALLAQGTQGSSGTSPTPPAAPASSATASGGMPDMTKMGPATRKLQHEADDKKAIQAMMKASMDAMEKGDVEASAAMIDFPVLMVTDSPTTSEASGRPMSREEWIAVMKPFAGPTPKDAKFSSKHTVAMLTDSLAQVISDYSVTMGGTKMQWKSADLVIRKNGKWLVKSMTEGGWGDMPVGEQAAKK